MVCDRCIMAIRDQLVKLSIPYNSIELGEVELRQALSGERFDRFRENVTNLGFEIIEDKTARIISGIKRAAIEYVRDPKANRKLKFSVYLSDRLHKDYHQLSTLFSSVEGTTIEQYLIHQKLERVKELLVYDELSLSEIAHLLGYSSVQHLSNQFKKVTGLTPSHFKQVREKRRKPLDQV